MMEMIGSGILLAIGFLIAPLVISVIVVTIAFTIKLIVKTFRGIIK